MGRKRRSPGDIFTLSISPSAYIAGQIILTDPFLYICIFSKLHGSKPTLEMIKTQMVPLLVGYVADAGFHDKSWEIIGRLDTPPGIPFPNYVVGTTLDGLIQDVVKSFNGDLIRVATPQDLEFYYRKTISSAEVFEGAASHYLLGKEKDWAYEKILASNLTIRERA